MTSQGSNAGDRYESVTNDIRVCVSPTFLEDQSSPEKAQWVWSYRIEIFNNGNETVQLRTRHWTITDANGQVEVVNGPGVVGEQPILNPGDEFQYTSGCPLSTPSGFMVGHYEMFREDGSKFLAAIPAFALDLPNARTSLN